jgi:hypothetical protein
MALADPVDIEGLARKHFPEDMAPTFVRIAQAESSGNPYAVNTNKNGTKDHGLYQINDAHLKELTDAGIIRSKEDLYVPDNATRAAAWLHKKYGTKPWDASKNEWEGSMEELDPWASKKGVDNDMEALDPWKKGGGKTPSPKGNVSEPARQAGLNKQVMSSLNPQQTNYLDRLKPESSLLQRIGSDLYRRGSSIGKEMFPSDLKPRDPWETLLRTGGQVAGGAGDVMGEMAESAYKTFTPKKIQKGISESARHILKTPIGQYGIEQLNKGMEYYSQFKKNYPDAAADLEAVVNIASLYPWGKGVSELTLPAVEKGAAKQVSKDALEAVSRDLSGASKAERATAFRRGAVSEPGFMKPAQIKITKEDEEIAKSVTGLVNKNDNPIKNIDNIRNKIAELGEQTRALPKENNRPFNRNQLRTVLERSRVESSDVFAMEPEGARKYDQMVRIFTRMTEGKPKKLSSVLEARKEFDKAIDAKFKNVWQRDSILSRAVRDVRMAANDFVADSLPEGNNFKELLKSQSNMYKAIDRITVKAAPALDRSRFQKLTHIMSAHPWITLEAGAGVAAGVGLVEHFGVGGALVNTLTHPLVLSGLALYGTAKVGKYVFTSQGVRTALVDFLRVTGKSLTGEEVSAVQGIIHSLEGGALLAAKAEAAKPRQFSIRNEEGQ